MVDGAITDASTKRLEYAGAIRKPTGRMKQREGENAAVSGRHRLEEALSNICCFAGPGSTNAMAVTAL